MAHPFVEFMWACEDGTIGSVMALIGSHIANRAVAVGAVVPIHEASNPAACRRDIPEGQSPVRRRALQRAKQCL